MSALGSLVVKLALEHAEYTQGLDRSSQEALKFAKGAQENFDRAGRSAKDFLTGIAGNVAGAITAVVGINASISKIGESINMLDRLDEATEKTGSSFEDLSRIAKVARNFGDAFDPIEQGITKLAKGLAQVDNPSSDAIRALNAIGVSAKDSSGQLRTAGDVYIDVAKKLQDYKDGAEKTAVANALFGKSGADLLPALNNLANGIGQVSATQEASAKQAAILSDAFARSKANVNGLFTELAISLLPTLTNIATAINSVSINFGTMNAVSNISSGILKAVAIAGFTVIDTFKGMGREIGARAAQLSALASLDFSGAKFIGQALAEDNAKSRAEYDKFVDTILNGEGKISSAMESGGSKKILKFQSVIHPAIDRTTNSIKEQTKAFDIEVHKLKEYEAEAKRARDITESVATKQERYNRTLEELERLKPYLGIENYNRALAKARDELDGVSKVNKVVTTEVSQLWIQAGRNIQTSLSNSIFAFFDTGLSGMVDSVKRAVMQITSEFAALKIGQMIGLDKIFGINSGIGGTGGVAGALNFASIGSSVSSMFKGGFGIPGALGSVGSSLPGSFGAFFSGMGGTGAAAARGSQALWGTSGLTGANAAGATMGSAFATAAGPLLVAFASTQIFKSLSGDKRLGGGFGKALNAVGDVPVLGEFLGIVPFLNGLFGRSPYKFRQQSLQGTASVGGFDGDITNVFRSKGGLLSGNKHKSISQALSQEQQDAFDTALNDFYGSAHKFAENLGLDVNLVDGFTKEFQIKSEKNQQLTSEAITEMLSGVGNDIAKNALPIVDSFRKAGEDSFATLSRLSDEFVSLKQAAENLGATSEYAKKLISGLSIQARSDFMAMAGGAEALAASTQFFYQNFLSEAERFSLASTRLNGELKSLGLSADLTIEQFKKLVQAESTTAELRTGLLSIIQDFYTVKSAADAAGSSINNLSNEITQGLINSLSSAFDILRNSVEKQRSKITEDYNNSIKNVNENINSVTESIGKLKSFGESLKSTINSIDPMRREFAKAQINTAIKTGRIDPDKLQSAVDSIKNIDSSKFTNSFDFEREQIKSAILLGDLNDAVGVQVDKQQAQLSLLNTQKDLLDAGFKNEMSRLDGILETAKMQLDTLNGINTSVIDLAAAIGMFNRTISQAGMTPSIGGGFVSGNAGISNQQINDFLKTPGLSDMDIYNAAKSNGVSFEQFSTATGKNLQDLYKWAEANGVPKFESGTPYVPNTGLAIVHKGERITPANQNNDNQVVIELKAIRDAIVKSNQEVIKRLGDGNKNMRAVMSGNASLRTSAS